MLKISPVTHQTLTDTVSARLAASILDGSLKKGTQLPPERELISQLGVSRATLRQALNILEQNKLIEARPNVGWFICGVDESNLAQAKELAAAARPAPGRPARSWPDAGALEARLQPIPWPGPGWIRPRRK